MLFLKIIGPKYSYEQISHPVPKQLEQPEKICVQQDIVTGRPLWFACKARNYSSSN